MNALKLVEIKRQAQKDVKSRDLSTSARDALEQLVALSDKVLELIASEEIPKT